MKGYLVLVLFAAVGTAQARNSVSGTIEKGIKWFLSNLSVRPAMTASIEYHVRYTNVQDQPILTFYYEGQNSPNLHDKCNTEMHGQLFNKDLAVPLYRNSTKNQRCYQYGCTEQCHPAYNCITTCTHRYCEGRIKIQDFEPKPYFFSLGFECKINRNLKGFEVWSHNLWWVQWDKLCEPGQVENKWKQGESTVVT